MMVILKAKYASDMLRKRRAQLERDELSQDWYQETRAVVLNVLEHRQDLVANHGKSWPSSQLEQPERAQLKASLDGLIRALNCTDEIRFSKHPVVLMTALGILLLLSMVGGTLLYYYLFLSG